MTNLGNGNGCTESAISLLWNFLIIERLGYEYFEIIMYSGDKRVFSYNRNTCCPKKNHIIYYLASHMFGPVPVVNDCVCSKCSH